MNFSEYFRTKQDTIEQYLRGLFVSSGILADFYAILRYALLAKSKRLRPVLVLMANELFEGSDTEALTAACALELIHTYSLVHDDLPAMDDDDLRRGVPTTHVKFGEGNAILAGDGLLTHAFALIAQSPVPPERICLAVLEIALAAGVDGMAGGQFLDLANEGRDIPFETLREIHSRKTGALIRASVRTGAIIGGADDAALRDLTAYGEGIGLAFQIQDDILDVTGDAVTIGKPVGSDEKRGKATYVKFFGVDGARERARNAVESAVASLVQFGGRAERLRELARYIIERDR